MNIVTRWYNRNKRIIWTILLIIAAIILLIQALDKFYEKKAEKESSSTNSTTAYNTNNYSIVTQDKIDETTSEKSDNLIDVFFGYCNNAKIEEAYDMISDDCKNELYPTINDFKDKYYNLIFTEKRSYDSVLWINTANRNTYRVQIMSDLLATGERDYMPIEDYYTIVNENGEYKLNVNRYIGKEIKNISKSQYSIDIEVISRKLYIDYEIYEVNVKNNTGNKIIFNTKQNTDSIYIQDENDLKYISFINEIADKEFGISAGFSKTFNIKINRGYKPQIKIKKIVFGDIKIQNFENLEEIEIEL